LIGETSKENLTVDVTNTEPLQIMYDPAGSRADRADDLFMISHVHLPGLCDIQLFYRNKPIAAEPQAGALAMCLGV
jgi:hypothetical protein